MPHNYFPAVSSAPLFIPIAYFNRMAPFSSGDGFHILQRNLSSPPPPHAVRARRGVFVEGSLLAARIVSSIMGDGDEVLIFP